MFKVNSISFSDGGQTISYDYSVNGIASYFNNKSPYYATYDTDVSMVPQSVSIIPLLANILPIAWFVGFDVYADEVDEDFYHSMQHIKNEFAKHHPQLSGGESQLHCRLVKNKIPEKKSVMLFSGGVDAFATYFRHFDEDLDLVTIQGADIAVNDIKQWLQVQKFNEEEPILSKSNKHYIISNFHEFYTVKVDLLLPNLGWWGNVQHGLALICVLAPLAYVRGYNKTYIASTRSIQMEFNPWGSMPEIDEQIRYAGVQVIHDGFELKRQDKVDSIVAAVKHLNAKSTVRVCYSDLKEGLNCSKCEKCLRTMFGIMLAGDDPNKYGFYADDTIYDRIQKAVSNGFKSRGTQFFWSEILEKAKVEEDIFVFSNNESERLMRKRTLEIIENNVQRELIIPSSSKKFKHMLINKYPSIFKVYLKLRKYL